MIAECTIYIVYIIYTGDSFRCPDVNHHKVFSHKAIYFLLKYLLSLLSD